MANEPTTALDALKNHFEAMKSISNPGVPKVVDVTSSNDNPDYVEEHSRCSGCLSCSCKKNKEGKE